MEVVESDEKKRIVDARTQKEDGSDATLSVTLSCCEKWMRLVSTYPSLFYEHLDLFSSGLTMSNSTVRTMAVVFCRFVIRFVRGRGRSVDEL